MSQAEDSPAATREAAIAEVLEIARTVAYALAIALVLRVVVFQPYTIPSASMEPGLLTGDYIVVSKWRYGWSRHSVPFSPPLPSGRLFGKAPERGEVAVFKLPRDTAITYVKRIVGLPGDRVQVTGGVVRVNGRAIPRTAIGPTADTSDPGLTVMQYAEARPDGARYVTFDRGPGREGDDTGVYVVPQGHYFAIGDNRDNSLDSRWPKALGVGFVPADNLVGRAEFALLSWREGVSILKPWTWFTHFEPKRCFRRLV